MCYEAVTNACFIQIHAMRDLPIKLRMNLSKSGEFAGKVEGFMI
jgi:hypothetical protein